MKLSLLFISVLLLVSSSTVKGQDDGCETPDTYLKDYSCTGYMTNAPEIVIDNFTAFKLITINPPAESQFISNGAWYYVISSGDYTVNFTSPNGCVKIVPYTAKAQALIPESQPLCLHSIVSVSFADFSDVDGYQLSYGLPGPQSSVDFDLPVGVNEVTYNSLASAQECKLRANLVAQYPKKSPSIAVTPVSCDLSVLGTVTVANAASYSSIKLGVVFQPTGIFSGLSAGKYTLTLVSEACGTEVILVIVPMDLPIITVTAITDNLGCNTNTFNATVTGDSAPTFEIDESGTTSSPPLTFEAGGTHILTYTRGSCLVIYNYVTLPEATADVTHTFSSVPTCKNPNTVVTVQSSHLASLSLVAGPALPDGKFNATYGGIYNVYDDCTSSMYPIELKRTTPTYTYSKTGGVTCLEKWDITVTNAYLFSSLVLVDNTDTTLNYTFGPSGVISNIPVGSYSIVSLEKDCSMVPLITILSTMDIYPIDLDESLFNFTYQVVEKSVCNLGGLLNVSVTYDGVLLQQVTVDYVPDSTIELPGFRQCLPFEFRLPNTYDFIEFPAEAPQILNTDTPCTQYDLVDPTVNIMVVNSPFVFPITGVSFNNGAIQAISQSMSFPTKATGDIKINVYRDGCSLPWQVVHNMPPNWDVEIPFTVTPQNSNDCLTATGAIQVNYASLDTLTIVGSDKVPVSNMFTGLQSQNYTLSFRIILENTNCMGTKTIFVPTTTNSVSITTKDVTDTCGLDKVVQVIAKDTSGQIIPVIGSVIAGQASFSDSSRTLGRFESYEPITAAIKNGYCQWLVDYTPTPPAHSPESLFSFEWVTYPTCPGTPNGVIRAINNFGINAVVNNVSSGSNLPTVGNLIYGIRIHENYNIPVDSQGSFLVGIAWNNDCYGEYFVDLDLTNVYPLPKYTVQYPNCGELNAKLIFDAASMAAFDLVVMDARNTIPYPINADGSVDLLASITMYNIQSTDRQTGCQRQTSVNLWYSDSVDTLNQVVIRNETCFGSSDATLIMPTTNGLVYHLSDVDYQNGEYNSFDSPSEYPYLPYTNTPGHYTGLRNNTYLMTTTSPTNPYCFSKQLVRIGLIQPTIVATTTDVCAADQLATISASLSDPLLSNLTYRVDSGATQKSGSISNLQPGQHTLQVTILDAQCHRNLAPYTFTVESNIITTTIDVDSQCLHAAISISSSNATAVYTVSLGGTVLKTGSKPLVIPSTVAGPFTATISDETGCSITKEITFKDCDISSSSSLKSSIIFVTISIISMIVLTIF
eukprot:gene4358-5088_t